MEQKNNQTPMPKLGSKKPKFNITWVYGIIVMILIGSYFFGDNVPIKDIQSYPTFKQYVSKGYVESIEVFPQKNLVEAVVKDSAEAMQTVFGESRETYKKESKD